MSKDTDKQPKSLMQSLVTTLKKLVGCSGEALNDDAIREQIGGFSATSQHRKPKKGSDADR